MIEIGAVASENTNLVLGNIAALDMDHSYSRFGRKNEAVDVASQTMSFDDVVDMINPLQHIPAISTIYRALADEAINPVSRIVGDTLYGGITGLASAGLSAIGAVTDEVVAANNDGQSASKTIVAALFGSGDDQTTQIASAYSGTGTVQASVQPPVAAIAASGTAASSNNGGIPLAGVSSSAPPSPTAVLQASAAQTNAALADLGTPKESADNGSFKGLFLDRSKLPYGGVMDSSMLASAQQNQALAMAMEQQHENMQAQRNLRNNRFEVAVPAATPASAAVSADSSLADPGTEAAMQNLLKELQAMKTINMYKNAAQNSPLSGGAFDVVN
jgi:hypothetical protein